MEPARDRAALNAVAAQLRCPYLLLEAGSNGTEIVALIRRMSLVIAMRLHTLIFAAGQGVPMVGVVYDPKVSGFLDYLGQDLYLPLEEANAASLCDLIDTAMAEQMFEAENIRSLRELAVSGRELTARGIPAGPALGQLLRELLEAVIAGEAENTPAALLALAEQKWRNQDGQADGSAGPGNGAGA